MTSEPRVNTKEVVGYETAERIVIPTGLAQAARTGGDTAHWAQRQNIRPANSAGL